MTSHTAKPIIISQHFTETHLQTQDSRDSVTVRVLFFFFSLCATTVLQYRPQESTLVTRYSPSPTINSKPYVHPPWGATSAVVGAERAAAAGNPEPPSRANTSLSTSISDIASELCHSPPSMGTFTPSPPSLSASSSGIFHPQTVNNNNGLPTRYPQPSDLPLPPSQLSNATFPTFASGTVLGSHSVVSRAPLVGHPLPLVSLSASPSPSPPLPTLPRAVGPVTPARRVAVHSRSQSQSQIQSQSQSQLTSHQLEPQQQPSSVRSKVSVAETPSGDLANFQLLNGSPLQSVVDFDTPTPSPRTPSMPSVSPADAQAFGLRAHSGVSLPLTADHRFLPGPGISPSVARAQRAVATLAAARSPFYCRICGVDPCLETTATACGHLFCNACIIEEVRENARCPVCNAAVLLFALLKLDIS